MKSILAPVFALSLATIAWSQTIPLTELVGPNNSIRDSVYGISATYPAGWQVRQAQRWGKNNLENTIFLQAGWPLESRPSLYYQPRTNFDSPAPGKEEAHFLHTAGTKAASRVSGLADYRNLSESFTFAPINGRPAFRYVANYTLNGKLHYEYFVRILGEKMMVMFFTQGPIAELDTLRREVDQMSSTVHVP